MILKEKFRLVFKGSLPKLIEFFDKTMIGEDFENAFQGVRELEIKQQIYSYDYIYIFYRSPDGLYVLFERKFD